MSILSKLKQKIALIKKNDSKKSLLAVGFLVLFFVFFYSNGANAFWGEGLVQGILQLILDAVLILLSMAEVIFQWIVDPQVMTAIINNTAVYETWRAVRDVFNIAFIMVLLFSAFATVFQVSKYNYKAVLQNLIIMALLVNFSYPIARFIVDVSNVIMYSLLQGLGGNTSFVSIIDRSGVTSFSTTEDPSLVFLFFAIIFTFIFGMTLLIIAVLLVIRTVTLAIYIMFSPIAFVGSILPGTKLASSGSEWWTTFMKHCFSGPIMVFMLYVANALMIAVISLQSGTLKTVAGTQVTGTAIANSLQDLLVKAAFFSMPVIVLWLGIIEAQKSGLAGASAVVSGGKKAGKWLAKNPLGGAVGLYAKQKGYTGAAKAKLQALQDKSPFSKSAVDARAAAKAAKGPFAVKGAEEAAMKRQSEEYKKQGLEEAELKSRAAKGDAAAAYRLSEDKSMDQDTYSAFTAKSKNEKLKKAINSKVKQNRNDLVATDKANDAKELSNTQNIENTKASLGHAPGSTYVPSQNEVSQYIANQQMGNLAAEKWNDQDWTTITQPIPALPATPTAAQIAEHAKKTADRQRIIDATINAWNGMTTQAQDEVRKRLTPNNAAALTSAGVSI